MAHHFKTLNAGVAELADALDLGSSVFDVGVRVPSPAPQFCGSSSVVEHHLAKVGVASSNLVFRSKKFEFYIEHIILGGIAKW